MNILLRIRGDVGKFPGGDYVQLLETKAALEKTGLTCTVAPGLDPVVGNFDVVHLFNTTRVHETWLQYSEARAKNIPVVLSPIWHSLVDMQQFYQHLYHLPFFPISGYLAAKEYFYARRSSLPVNISASLNFRSIQRRLIAGCDAVLPNSEAELEVLTRESGVAPRKSFISPLGFKRQTLPDSAVERRDVICAGRIEPRKNPLAVVRAFKRLPRDGRKLRLYGQINTSHTNYSKLVLAECVEGWVEYGGNIPQDNLMKAFAECRVAVLMSFFETFGLTALEGLSTGAVICLSDTAYNRGIYGSRAIYADPYSEESIADSLARSFTQPMAQHEAFLQNYTWENAASTTLAAYKYVSKR